METSYKTIFYLVITIIHGSISSFTFKLILNIYKNNQSHPYIVTFIYFSTYLLFFIPYFYFNPKTDKKELYEHLQNETENKNEKYKMKMLFIYELITPSILLAIGYGLCFYTLGRIHILLNQIMQGCVVYCVFKILGKDLKSIKMCKIIGTCVVMFGIIGFLVFNLIKGINDLNYLLLFLLSFISAVLIGLGKYINYKKIQNHKKKIILKNVILNSQEKFGKNVIPGDNNIIINDNNYSINSDEKPNNNLYKNEKILINKKENICYEKIIFYEGIICMIIWGILCILFSTIKCPEKTDDSLKIFICNNCTTISGLKSFFDPNLINTGNKSDIKKDKKLSFFLKYPLYIIFLIIIVIITEFFHHLCYQKVFSGKYKTKLSVLINPLVAIIIIIFALCSNKFMGANSIMNLLRPKILCPTEIIISFIMILGTLITTIKI